jgi:hypothetical protein
LISYKFKNYNLFLKMPPKGKDAKKGAVSGNFKAGKALKDILPATSKPPREGVIARMEGEPEV